MYHHQSFVIQDTLNDYEISIKVFFILANVPNRLDNIILDNFSTITLLLAEQLRGLPNFPLNYFRCF